MKKIFSFTIILLLLTLVSLNNPIQAQNAKTNAALDFCNSYTKGGIPINPDDVWNCIGHDACYLYAIVNLPYYSQDSYIDFYVYQVEDYNLKSEKEYYYNSSVVFNPGMSFCWAATKLTFSSPGFYRVYVYTRETSSSEQYFVGYRDLVWKFR